MKPKTIIGTTAEEGRLTVAKERGSICTDQLIQKRPKSTKFVLRLTVMIAALAAISFLSAPEASAYPTEITFDVRADTGEFYLVNRGTSTRKYKLSKQNRKILMKIWAAESKETSSRDLLAAVIFFSDPGPTSPNRLAP